MKPPRLRAPFSPVRPLRPPRRGVLISALALTLASAAAAGVPDASAVSAPVPAPGDASPSAAASPGSAPPEQASGQATSGDSGDADVEALLNEGIRLRRAGRDEDALGVLLRAAAQAPDSPRVRAHVAAAHQALGEWLEAEAALDLLLHSATAATDPYVARNRQLLQDALVAVRTHIGQIEVLGDPAGAAAALDGRPLGPLPLGESVKALGGTHVLEVSAPGHYPVSRQIQVKPGALVKESVHLIPLPAGPVDGESAARTPRVVPWVLAGASAAAAVTGALAWALRERAADRWNGETCLVLGATREQRCGDERRAAERYGDLAAVSGVAAGGLAVSALVTHWLGSPEPAASEGVAEKLSCFPIFSGIECHARF